MASLPAFTAIANCPKCDTTGVKIDHHDPLITTCPISDEEHLHYICNVCGDEWATKTKDNV